MTTQFNVPSVSCQHCVNAITTAVSKLPGVSAVQVDLATKQVRVDTTQAVPAAQLQAAIADAGYEDAVLI